MCDAFVIPEDMIVWYPNGHSLAEPSQWTYFCLFFSKQKILGFPQGSKTKIKM